MVKVQFNLRDYHKDYNTFALAPPLLLTNAGASVEAELIARLAHTAMAALQVLTLGMSATGAQTLRTLVNV